VATGLASGATGENELVDVILAATVQPVSIVSRVQPYLPKGLVALEAWEVGMGLPSLPASIRWSDYVVEVHGCNGLEARVSSFLATTALQWEDTRGEKVRTYDIRSLVGEIDVERCAGRTRLHMRLRTSPLGVGRPDQVVKALGLPEPVSIHRTHLLVAESSPARSSWRRRGRYL
jgi:radical SAM-linked protein